MILRLFLGALFLTIGYSHASALDSIGEPPAMTLPVEVALNYMKNTNQTPDFDSLAKNMPGYRTAPEFAKNAFLYKERETLREIYNGVDKNSAFIVFDDLLVKEFSRKSRDEQTSADDLGAFFFDGFNDDRHYTYQYNGETYVVFIRNIQDYAVLPLRKETSYYVSSAYINGTHIAAELTLRPVLYDDTLFELDDGTMAHLILGDLVDLKLIRYESGKVIYHEIAAQWKPKSRIDRIVKDIIPEDF